MIDADAPALLIGPSVPLRLALGSLDRAFAADRTFRPASC
jgi:hypothetical protein